MVHYSLALLLTAALAAAFDSTEIRMLQDESGVLPDGFGAAGGFGGPIRLQSRLIGRSDPRIRRQSSDRIMEALGSIRLVKMTKANGKQHQEEEEDSSLEDKRSAPLIRFGKRSIGDEEMARTVRQDQGLGSPLIRFGKRSAPDEEEIVEDDGDIMERFGRAPSSAPLIRFGKRSSTAPFVRFGRTASAPLIRFGKRSAM
ncbi:flp-13 [Pristionchus pacificus]|uniref:Flp-13 n=1 Tax=Pristionchus pacificus TaxID=54126 RepID=A0A2A6BVT3_PRIPA|nr:flp-13 [Pristionchus pacificus]|eukprot:PDM70030.1 flp-13 [Pristionchus pacificus]